MMLKWCYSRIRKAVTSNYCLIYRLSLHNIKHSCVSLSVHIWLLNCTKLDHSFLLCSLLSKANLCFYVFSWNIHWICRKFELMRSMWGLLIWYSNMRKLWFLRWCRGCQSYYCAWRSRFDAKDGQSIIGFFHHEFSVSMPCKHFSFLIAQITFFISIIQTPWSII